MIHKDMICLVDKKPGIYILFNKNKQVIYIGISQKLRNRLYNHFRTKKEFTYFRISYINLSKIDLMKIEKKLTQRLKPKLNRVKDYYNYRDRPEALRYYDVWEDYQKHLSYLKAKQEYEDNLFIGKLIEENFNKY